MLDIEGMTCASCVQKVERALGDVDGVQAAAVNLATRTATVRGAVDGFEPLIGAVARVGYGARPHDDDRDPSQEERAYRRRLLVAAPLTAVILVLTFGFAEWGPSVWLAWALATPVQFYAGWPFLRSAWRTGRHGSATMDTLIALGSMAAYLYSVWAVLASRAAGEPAAAYFDTGAVIITLILVGKTLEARARIAAADASRVAPGARCETGSDRPGRRNGAFDRDRGCSSGMRAVVLAGEKIPADGVVKEGESWVDLSLLTGESVPVDVGPGSEVVGASINGHGRLVVFITKVGAHTKLSEIVRLLQAAQGSKAPVQRLADRISAVFVPIVLGLAAATFLGWMLVAGAAPGDALLHATAVLLIACPCALGLATPAAIMAGTGRAAELGVLCKGGEVFEAARAVDTVLLDKTGTVTEGSMRLEGVVAVNGATEDDVLLWAAAAESGSEHPIARAIVQGARDNGLEVPPVTEARVEPGAGARALLDGEIVRVGRPDGLPTAMATIAEASAKQGLTPIAVWRDGIPFGLLTVSDTVKPEAAEAVAALAGAWAVRPDGDGRSAGDRRRDRCTDRDRRRACRGHAGPEGRRRAPIPGRGAPRRVRGGRPERRPGVGGRDRGHRDGHRDRRGDRRRRCDPPRRVAAIGRTRDGSRSPHVSDHPAEPVLGVRVQRGHDPARRRGPAQPDVGRRRDGDLQRDRRAQRAPPPALRKRKEPVAWMP